MSKRDERIVESVSVHPLAGQRVRACDYPDLEEIKEQAEKIANMNPDVVEWRADFYDVKGIVDALLAELGVTSYEINRGTEPYFHPGVSAQYVVDGKIIAQYGELHPQVSKNFDLPGKVYMFEIDLEAVLSIIVPPFRYQSFSKFPGTSRDLAIVAPVSVTSGDIVALIKEHGGEYLESVSIFDVYEGEHIEAGYRSLAYNLQFRSM